ncbi:MAG TPA: hypothetical protein VJ739_19180, partial [Gemmataceae bacterium]|nr:hypothetical protein [Gemmataceae bacterium]
DGVAPTPAAVRAYRAELLRKPESTAILGPVAGLDDLFSASMVHHLFFPAHGHQYTLAELERCAAACGLCLLGYRLPRQVRRRVAPPTGPATFARWRELEMAYTGSLGMFVCTLYLPTNSPRCRREVT